MAIVQNIPSLLVWNFVAIMVKYHSPQPAFLTQLQIPHSKSDMKTTQLCYNGFL